MTLPRVAIIGDGKMGRVLEQLAREWGWPVASVIGASDNEGGRAIARERLADATVAIEFTVPAAAPGNVRACVRAGCPIVVGTTGWYEQLPSVAREVHDSGGAMLYAPNFSIGVNLFWRIAEFAASAARRVAGFDAHIVETHHAAKKDAPSGTALELGRRASEALGHDIPITSVRVGSVPGTHELLFDGAFEQLRIEHVARDRRVFAEGALLAARWLIGKRGVFTMADFLAGDPTE